MMQINRDSLLERTYWAEPRRLFESRLQCQAWLAKIGNRDKVAPVDPIKASVWQINRRSHSGLRAVQFVAVTLKRTDSRL